MKQHRIKTSKDIFEIFLRQAVIDSVYREAENTPQKCQHYRMKRSAH